MIGRFSKLGVYQELFRLRDFYFASGSAVLSLLGFFVDYWSPAATRLGDALDSISVAVNGTPIVWGAVKGLINREVNVDELVSLTIFPDGATEA